MLQSYFLRAGLVVILAALVSQAVVAVEAVGKVAVLKGGATRTADSGVRVKLNRGDNIYDGDRINSESRSFIVLVFKDKTRFNL